MRWLVSMGIVATTACTRLNPEYGDGGGTAGGTANDADASVSDDAIATLDDDDDDDSNVDSSPDDGNETGADNRPCCVPHTRLGCEDTNVTECVCDQVPECCEIEWNDHCVQKARDFCSADCGVVDDGPLEGGTSTTPMTSDESDSITDSASTGSTSTTEGSSSTGGLGDSDCCEPHKTPGCDDEDTANCVCKLMPACCGQQWNDLCVEATARCPVFCPL